MVRRASEEAAIELGYQADELGHIYDKFGARVRIRIGPQGYGSFYTQAGVVSAHRFVCRFFYGPIPKGFHVHHINCDRSSNAPANLQSVTVSENMKRKTPGASFPGRQDLGQVFSHLQMAWRDLHEARSQDDREFLRSRMWIAEDDIAHALWWLKKAHKKLARSLQ